jgi:hypothetical protein
MKTASLLIALLLITPSLSPSIAQARQLMQPASTLSADPSDRIQTLINQKQYDRAWQEIRQIGKNYFTQQQPTLGLASLRQALLASLDLVDDLDQRDGSIEQIALLYQQQKQPKLARDTAQKLFKSDRRQALLNKLK